MRIGLTLGDPAGIGPEIVVASVAALTPTERAELVIYGDRGVLARAAAALGVSLDAALDGARLEAVTRLGADEAAPGRPDVAGGRAQVAYLEAATAAARRGELAALVTAPLSKTWAQRAGFAFPGHTEYLGHALGAERVIMAFVGPKLCVALATIHVALADVPRVLDAERVADAAELGARLLAERLGVATPRIGVLGLNPHAGEGGLFGDDEARVIAPGIAAARAAPLGGLAEVHGPIVPDAAYRDALWPAPPGAAGGARPPRWDLLVAAYHDQGLIPVKLVDFDLSVNVTLGLPGVVRTSPDHGTAYDLAGQGRARPASFAAALALAGRLV